MKHLSVMVVLMCVIAPELHLLYQDYLAILHSDDIDVQSIIADSHIARHQSLIMSFINQSLATKSLLQILKVAN